MKRKALITSTAILLVAVMCLATASYAWFTAGTQATIEAFNISIEAADSALQLAPADMSNGYAAGTYVSALDKADWAEGWAIMDENFQAVSTADGANFYTAPYSDATNQWKSDALASDGYLLFSFYAKAPVDGSATLNITTNGNSTFNSAVKVGVKVGSGDFNTYDLAVDENDKYQPMTAVGAACEKVDGYFVPVSGATGFGAARTQEAYAAQTVNFEADVEQLITVAVWLEGMDKDCTGSWSMSGQEVSVNFTGWTAA